MPIPYTILPQLAEALSRLYRTLDLAMTMATTAGLDVWKIPLGSTTFAAWVAILEEAEHYGHTEVILRRAQDDYRVDAVLGAACQAYAAWVSSGRPDVGFPGREATAGTNLDQNTIIFLSGYSNTQLQQLRQTLDRSLPTGQAILRVDAVSERLMVLAPDTPAIVLSKEAAKALLGMASSENEYLTALRVHPDYGRWTSQFVPLAGSMPLPPQAPGWSDLPPEFTMVESHGEGPSRQLQRTELKDISEATTHHPAFALTGAPGAGKTTTLYKLALDAATQRHETGQGRLPLYLPLSEYRDYLSPFDFVKARFEQRLGKENLGNYLRQGDLLLLLDALNEMPAADARDYGLRVGAWRRFIDDWAGNQVIVSCRSRDYHEKLGVPEVEIKQLDDKRVQDFLHKYLPQGDLAARTWRRLDGSTLLSLVRNPYYLRMLVYVVRRGGQWPTTVAQLFRNFTDFLLQREELRHHRGWPGIELMQEALKQVAERIQPSGSGTKLPRLEFMALVPAQVDGPNGLLTLSPPDVVDHGIAATLLDAEEPDGVEHVRFYHHLLQEYFAALALVDRFCRDEDLAVRWQAPRLVDEMPDPGPLRDDEPLPPPPTTRWEEPTILAAGLVPDLAGFVAAVQQVNPALAARCLTESGLAPPSSLRVEAQQRLLAELANPAVHLRARLAAGEALGRLGDPRFREVVVNGQRVLLPPLVHIPGGKWQVGSTPAEIDELKATGFPANDEGPRHPVELAAFWVGQYPVTNAEWGCFMAAGGYQELAHWETAEAQAWLRGEEAESGAVKETMDIWRAIRQDPSIPTRYSWTPRAIRVWAEYIQIAEDEFRAAAIREYGDRRRDQPHYWDDARFNSPSQPVVGITWYEARAYCHWLDGVLRRAQEQGLLPSETLPPGHAVRLPTEAQWERAARGPQRWKYPWGNGWDAGKANTFEGHVLRTNTVGAYPQGVSAEGVHDLSGNVWEWTLSRYQDYPIRANDGRNDPAGDSRRVVRGGSWFDHRGDARAAYRDGGVPGDFFSDVGLRVVVSLSSGF